MGNPQQLTARDITHRDMLRSTAAMIQARWPGEYDGLAQRLEELTWRIERTTLPEICELPHLTTEEEEEDACEDARRGQEQFALAEGN